VCFFVCSAIFLSQPTHDSRCLFLLKFSAMDQRLDSLILFCLIQSQTSPSPRGAETKAAVVVVGGDGDHDRYQSSRQCRRSSPGVGQIVLNLYITYL